jgi:hypothetical protein
MGIVGEVCGSVVRVPNPAGKHPASARSASWPLRWPCTRGTRVEPPHGAPWAPGSCVFWPEGWRASPPDAANPSAILDGPESQPVSRGPPSPLTDARHLKNAVNADLHPESVVRVGPTPERGNAELPSVRRLLTAPACSCTLRPAPPQLRPSPADERPPVPDPAATPRNLSRAGTRARPPGARSREARVALVPGLRDPGPRLRAAPV